MNVGTLFAALKLDTKNFEKSLENAGVRLGRFNKVIAMAGAAVAVGVVAALGASVSAAIDFESAFTGVMKTVDASAQEYAELERGIRDMALEMPLAAGEIAGVAEAAGQLGIENKNILGFAEVMSKLGVTTNLSADTAATSLARLANITQMPQTEFDRLGSTIVALGNNMATTEAEIVEMAMRLAGAGAQIGLTEAQTLGLSAALSSVGIEAAAGGSAISRVMIDMASQVASGGERLESFAMVAGMSAAEFQRAYKEDAAGALVTFIEGLGRVSESGEDVFAVLEDLGLSEVRVRDALLRAAGAGDLFREAIELGSEAWEENTALNKEAELRFGTTASKIQIMWNKVTELAITIGQALLPIVNGLVDALGWLAETLTAAAGHLAGFGDIVEFLKPGLIAIGAAITLAVIPAIVSMAAAAIPAGLAMAAAFAPVVLTVAAITAAVVALSAAVNYFAMDFGDMGDRIHEIADEAGKDFNEVKEWIRDYMEETGASFEEASRQANRHFNGMSEDQRALVEESGAQWEAYQEQIRAVPETTGEVADAVAGDLGGIGVDAEQLADQLGISVEEAEAYLERMGGDFGEMADTVGEETEEADEHVKTFIESVIERIQNAEDPIRQGGEAAAEAWLDPIRVAAEISALESELASDELRENLRSEDENIRRDAELRTAEITAELIKLKNEQALQGEETAQIAKQKALLTSEFMAEGLASEDEEIAAIFRGWKEDIEANIESMENRAANNSIPRDFADAIRNHGYTAVQAVQEMADQVRGIFPSSEPRNPRSPFRGITKGWGFGKVLDEGLRVSLRGVDLGGPMLEKLGRIGFAGGVAQPVPHVPQHMLDWAHGQGTDRPGLGDGRVTVRIEDPDGAIRRGGYDQGMIERMLEEGLRESFREAGRRAIRQVNP